MSSEWDDTVARRWAAALFSDAPKPTSTSSDEPRLSNHVAREGGNVTPRASRSGDVREFVADLFGVDENARGLNRDDWT